MTSDNVDLAPLVIIFSILGRLSRGRSTEFRAFIDEQIDKAKTQGYQSSFKDAD